MSPQTQSLPIINENAASAKWCKLVFGRVRKVRACSIPSHPCLDRHKQLEQAGSERRLCLVQFCSSTSHGRFFASPYPPASTGTGDTTVAALRFRFAPPALRHGAGYNLAPALTRTTLFGPIRPRSPKGGRLEIRLILIRSACTLPLIKKSLRCRSQFNRICMGKIRGGPPPLPLRTTRVLPENNTECV